MLQVTDLSVSFTREDRHKELLIDGVSFSVKYGKTFVLLGESGSGKSLTAMAIMRLLPSAIRITGGNILFADQDLLALPEVAMRGIRGRRIAMIFQEPQTSLNPVLTIGSQIGEVLALHKKLTGTKQLQRSIELLDLVGISQPEQRIYEYPHQLSGGMKQRAMVAIALAGEPDLLIADEPTTALDVTIQAQVLELLKQIQKDTGMGILFITHDLAVAYQMSDDIAVMRSGKIIEKNSRDAFYSNPSHAYSRELLAALPAKMDYNGQSRTAAEKAIEIREQPLLKVSNLKVNFPIRKGIFKRTVNYVRAVDEVSINIYHGRTLAIVGESGSGKTTLGKGILQLLRISGGSVIFDGQELTDLPAEELRKKRSDIQVVFQDPYSSMNPRMLVADIIAEGMIVQNIGGSERQRLQRIDELLEKVGLDPSHKYRYPHEFSGGQRQRICVARALAVEPKLIICDEPTSSLDVSMQAQILNLFKKLQSGLGLSYLFITHNIDVVRCLAHDVVVMYNGRIVEQGIVNEVLNNPQDPYTQKLLAAVPRIPGNSDQLR